MPPIERLRRSRSYAGRPGDLPHSSENPFERAADYVCVRKIAYTLSRERRQEYWSAGEKWSQDRRDVSRRRFTKEFKIEAVSLVETETGIPDPLRHALIPVFDHGLQATHEQVGHGAVEQSMVEGKRHVANRANRNRIINNHRLFVDCAEPQDG